eukprot:TRINITY_DN3149_c0_g1_i2.p1 TRINITY_DN3149_c0_g1~~TRINITY_DN3149_c0_g1_i2.p1  ORF type:complete len:249 (-),score=71.70 TRINITY_DN3149_c0_g1_i2:132-878(-)
MFQGYDVKYERKLGETTEWEDALEKHGVIKPLYDSDDNLSEESEEEYQPHKYENKSLKELKEVAEEDDDSDDEAVRRKYIQQRMEEFRQSLMKPKFGSVLSLSKADYVKEVTEASKSKWVVVHLHQDHIMTSKRMQKCLAEVAGRKGEIKFMEIIADQCMENYPDSNVPTLLLYHEGVNKKQIVGSGLFGGSTMTADDLEWVLSQMGVCKTTMTENPRAKKDDNRKGYIGRYHLDDDREVDSEDDIWA